MSKRFTDTEIWEQDWFLEMPNEYKLFYFYVKDSCDHAGIFKVNLTSFCLLNKTEINSEKALKYFNKDKQRIIKLSTTKWYLQDFFVYQYGTTFNINNRVHKSAETILNTNNLTLSSIRGLKEVNDRVKDKDKDKDIDKEENKDVKKPPKELDEKYYRFLDKALLNFVSKPKGEKERYEWADEIRKTVEIDKHPINDVFYAVEWARKDTFWIKNFRSMKKLRDKIKNSDEMYIDLFLNNMPKKPRTLSKIPWSVHNDGGEN